MLWYNVKFRFRYKPAFDMVTYRLLGRFSNTSLGWFYVRY